MPTEPITDHVRVAITIQGAVQGVGFRPFVWHLANDLNCIGWVANNAMGVEIEVQGRQADVAIFRGRLIKQPPPLAQIANVSEKWIATRVDQTGFAIRESHGSESVSAFVSPDVATCEACLKEVRDPQNRRFAYPFTNCTHCGPRFTIQRDVPYDRATTTMNSFGLCEACLAEYHSPADRRFHAQPNACPKCGPTIWLVDAAAMSSGNRTDCEIGPVARATADVQEALAATRRAIAEGKTVAIKGLGGFHLACNAHSPEAVALLRQRKRRPCKPLAVMAADMKTVQSIVQTSQSERRILASRERPIVLLRKMDERGLPECVAPGNPYLGVLLPYTPLHDLLMQPGDVWVMTSGNVADEPIAFDNADALRRLAHLCDAFLLHDRPIHTVCDDSVVRVVGTAVAPIRRSRGYAPLPISLRNSMPRVKPNAASSSAAVGVVSERSRNEPPTVLAVGGELKAAICLAAGDQAFLSQHIGDMGNRETIIALERAVEHLRALYRAVPRIIAADLHPGYISTQWAERLARDQAIALVRVQHHHAHAASLIAEHQLPMDQPIIACVFDGTGYGTDGAIWGGEVLIASGLGYRRVACLRYARLPGGDNCIVVPAKTALAFLHDYGLGWPSELACVQYFSDKDRERLRLQLDKGLNAVATSSMGRMFDVVAALIGVRHEIDYEGQAAVELESLAEQGMKNEREIEPYRYSWQAGDLAQLDMRSTLQAIMADLRAGVAACRIAARWHQTVASAVVEQCNTLRLNASQSNTAQLNRVGLTGGVFQNSLLTQLLTERLEQAGFSVLTHRVVPCNDGGLALGQALVAMC